MGQAAAIAGVSADTLRYYERKGLLPDVPRTDSGYRQYSPANIERIRLVRSALQLGFSVKQIAGFLRARDAGRPPCLEVRRAALSLADEMDRQIKQMVMARSALRRTLKIWDRRLARTPPGTPAHLLESRFVQSENRHTHRASSSLSRPFRRRS